MTDHSAGRGRDMTVSVPSYEQAEAAVHSGSCTALQRFVYEQEAANFDDIWRVQLTAALVEIVADFGRRD